jgi:hypothetical protein
MLKIPNAERGVVAYLSLQYQGARPDDKSAPDSQQITAALLREIAHGAFRPGVGPTTSLVHVPN